jgi:hypothetical protein
MSADTTLKWQWLNEKIRFAELGNTYYVLLRWRQGWRLLWCNDGSGLRAPLGDFATAEYAETWAQQHTRNGGARVEVATYHPRRAHANGELRTCWAERRHRVHGWQTFDATA